jgi:putative membrane protein
MTFHRISIALLTGTLCCVPALAQDTAAPATTTAASSVPAVVDATFLKKAGAGGAFEIQAGQIAAQKGNTDAVKSFGQQMVTDHTKLNADITPIAAKMGVMIPPKKLKKPQQAELDKLNGLSGADFDNEYIMAMVKAHRMDAHAFHEEEMNTADPDLKAAVVSAEKVIHHHLEMIEQIAKDQNVTIPASGHGKHKQAAAPADAPPMQ